MPIDTQARIEKLLDQLEKPGVTLVEIEKIERKIQFLRNLES